MLPIKYAVGDVVEICKAWRDMGYPKIAEVVEVSPSETDQYIVRFTYAPEFGLKRLHLACISHKRRNVRVIK